ncbi:MAG: AI-2E family transporter, partial [Niameybacter sp.]
VLAVMALQQVDGWFIVPKVMGKTVKLHPIAVLLAIVIGGELFGLIGILLGVPVAAFIRLLIIRYMGDLFNGEET